MQPNQNPFRTSDYFVRTGAPRVEAFIRSALSEQKPPKSLRERNLAQLQLAERVRGQFELDITSAVEAVAPLYGQKFPH
jgi:hypothetical protein